MGALALILGILGGLCAVMGILNTAGIEEIIISGFDTPFWFSLAAILLLSTIACLLARGVEGGYE